QAAGQPPRGFAAALEATVLYIRQEVILPNVGAHGEGYVNYLLTVFFFLLTCNLLGLLPWGATPTSNIAVTGAMALVSLAVIEISGMRALGLKGYLGTIFFLPEGLPTLLKPVMLVIMTPIEIIGLRRAAHGAGAGSTVSGARAAVGGSPPGQHEGGRSSLIAWAIEGSHRGDAGPGDPAPARASAPGQPSPAHEWECDMLLNV